MGGVLRPLHHVHVQSDVITEFFAVAVYPALPISGITMLMGNDIVGGKVSPTLKVLDTLPTSPPSNTELDSKLFPSCVITRAQAQKLN